MKIYFILYLLCGVWIHAQTVSGMMNQKITNNPPITATPITQAKAATTAQPKTTYVVQDSQKKSKKTGAVKSDVDQNQTHDLKSILKKMEKSGQTVDVQKNILMSLATQIFTYVNNRRMPDDHRLDVLSKMQNELAKQIARARQSAELRIQKLKGALDAAPKVAIEEEKSVSAPITAITAVTPMQTATPQNTPEAQN